MEIYEKFIQARGMRLRSGISIYDFANLLSACSAGVALHVLGNRTRMSSITKSDDHCSGKEGSRLSMDASSPQTSQPALHSKKVYPGCWIRPEPR